VGENFLPKIFPKKSSLPQRGLTSTPNDVEKGEGRRSSISTVRKKLIIWGSPLNLFRRGGGRVLLSGRESFQRPRGEGVLRGGGEEKKKIDVLVKKFTQGGTAPRTASTRGHY